MEKKVQEVAQTYNSLSGRYDHHHVDAKSLAENEYIRRYLKKRIRPGMKIVDLGCGTGLLLELCQVSEKDYLGLDISTGMLEQARRKFPLHQFMAGDMQERNECVTDGSADLVVSLFGSASYCDIARVRAEVWRMLKPGGVFFLMFCGPHYVHRETYITKSNTLLNAYTRETIQTTFNPDKIWGMSKLVDRFPKRVPAILMNAILSLEIATLGRYHPDGCFFINAWGSRSA